MIFIKHRKMVFMLYTTKVAGVTISIDTFSYNMASCQFMKVG